MRHQDSMYPVAMLSRHRMDLLMVIFGIVFVLTAYKWHSANYIILTCLSTCHHSPFLFFFFFSMQHCKSESCRECHKDALACLDFQQYYYEKYINLSVWKGFKGCCIHLLPEAEHLITQTQFSKKIISFSHVHLQYFYKVFRNTNIGGY